MTLIRRVLTSFREDEQAEAQMFQKDDGTFWLRAADGSETQVGSGSGSASSTITMEMSTAQIGTVNFAETQFAPALSSSDLTSFIMPGNQLTSTPYVVAPSSDVVDVTGTSMVVFDVPAVSFNGVPLSGLLNANLYVTDQTGANVLFLEVRTKVSLPINHAGANIDWADLTGPPVVVGTDLSWGGSGVSSAAGGVFTTSLNARFGYAP